MLYIQPLFSMSLPTWGEFEKSSQIWEYRAANKETNQGQYPAAAAAAKSLQSCPTLCSPIDGSPPGSPVPGILQCESEKWKWSRSVVSDSSHPHGLQPTRLLRPWDFPGKSTGVGCRSSTCLLHDDPLNIRPSGAENCILGGVVEPKDRNRVSLYLMRPGNSPLMGVSGLASCL